MSRITYTKKGNPSNNKDKTLPITSAPFKIRLLWALGNLFGINQIKRNAVKSRGFGFDYLRPVKDKDANFIYEEDGTIKMAPRTYTSINFGKWVAYRRNSDVLPKYDIRYKRTMVDGDYQITPVSYTNTTMQMIRIPARLV